MSNRVIVLTIATLILWSGNVWTAPGPIQSSSPHAMINPASVPVQHQLNLLRSEVTQLHQQLTNARREIADLRARYQRHSHTYTAPGTYSGISADALVAKGSLYHGRGIVLLGGQGTQGNVGPLYRVNGARTSGPAE